MIQFMLPNHKSVCQVPRPCPAVTTEGARHPTKLGLNQRCTQGPRVGANSPVSTHQRPTEAPQGLWLSCPRGPL